MSFQYFIPTRIIFGKGSLASLHEQKLPGKKALIVISAGKSTKANGYLDKLQKELDISGVSYAVYDKISPNPTKTQIMEGSAMARQNNCDFVIGLGGGSSIDSSKAIAIMATNPGDYWDYIWSGTGKNKPVEIAPLPIVAITTTAGTGTEADPWTVVTNEDTDEKIGYGFDATFPALSIVDSELMHSVPANLTAYQGFDALFHSAEGYINKIASPLSDIFALKSIELVAKSLAKAVANGKDADARDDIALANTLAGMVESVSGCTSEHSLAHALSAINPEVPHGAGLIAISKEYFKRFVEIHACDQRFIDMARAMGKNDSLNPMDFVDALVELQKACNVDNVKLSDFNVDGKNLRKYVDNAIETMGSLFSGDPVPTSADDCVAILEKSYR